MNTLFARFGAASRSSLKATTTDVASTETALTVGGALSRLSQSARSAWVDQSRPVEAQV